MASTADGNGIILLDWLRVLGWSVEIEREGEEWVGVAHYAQSDDPELRVGGCATALTGLAWQLFIGAVERLQARSRPALPTLRAA